MSGQVLPLEGVEYAQVVGTFAAVRTSLPRPLHPTVRCPLGGCVPWPRSWPHARHLEVTAAHMSGSSCRRFGQREIALAALGLLNDCPRPLRPREDPHVGAMAM